MTTTANSVRDVAQESDACTFYGGYAVKGGRRIMFEPARTIEEKRNAAGRVTRYVGEYADGSRIVYTWSAAHGPRFTAKEPKP